MGLIPERVVFAASSHEHTAVASRGQKTSAGSQRRPGGVGMSGLLVAFVAVDDTAPGRVTRVTTVAPSWSAPSTSSVLTPSLEPTRTGTACIVSPTCSHTVAVPVVSPFGLKPEAPEPVDYGLKPDATLVSDAPALAELEAFLFAILRARAERSAAR